MTLSRSQVSASLEFVQSTPLFFKKERIRVVVDIEFISFPIVNIIDFPYRFVFLTLGDLMKILSGNRFFHNNEFDS